jgi:signal transduction histidine kinase
MSGSQRFVPRNISIRVRLTTIYALLFIATGVMLLGVNYKLVERRLPGSQIALGRLSPKGSEVTIQLAPDEKALREILGAAALDAESNASEANLTAEQQRKVEGLIRNVSDRLRSTALSTLLRQSGIALSFATVLSVLAGWLIAGRALRPVHNMTHAAQRLSDGNLSNNLSERIPLGGSHDEIHQLGATFNNMLDRLQQAFHHERLLIANASHELRTPLANQRTVLEVGLDNPCASIEDLRTIAEQALLQTIRNEKLVDRLFHLARTTNLDGASTERVDLSQTVENIVSCQPNSEIVCTTKLQAAWVNGDRILLEQLVTNLVDNAQRHNVAGGSIHIETIANKDNLVRMLISNTGQVVTNDQLETIVQPFRRLGGDRTSSHRGVGLGLTLVSAITNAHGGSLQIDAPRGGGLSITVTLPVCNNTAPSLK